MAKWLFDSFCQRRSTGDGLGLSGCALSHGQKRLMALFLSLKRHLNERHTYALTPLVWQCPSGSLHLDLMREYTTYVFFVNTHFLGKQKGDGPRADAHRAFARRDMEQHTLRIYNSTHLLPVSSITSQMRLNGRQLDKLTSPFSPLSLSHPSVIFRFFFVFFLHLIVSAMDAWSLRPRFFRFPIFFYPSVFFFLFSMEFDY